MNLDEILKDAEREFAAAASLPILDQVKARYLGKSGAIPSQMKTLGALPAEERKAAGARINQAKDQVETLLRGRRDAIQAAELERQLAAESLDVTLPGRGEAVAGLHPVAARPLSISECPGADTSSSRRIGAPGWAAHQHMARAAARPTHHCPRLWVLA